MARLAILFCFQLFLTLTLVQGKPLIVDNDRVLKEIQRRLKVIEENIEHGAEIIGDVLLPKDVMILPIQSCQILEIINRRGASVDKNNELIQGLVNSKVNMNLSDMTHAIEKELNPTESQYVIDGVLDILKNHKDPEISGYAYWVDGIIQRQRTKTSKISLEVDYSWECE